MEGIDRERKTLLYIPPTEKGIQKRAGSVRRDAKRDPQDIHIVLKEHVPPKQHVYPRTGYERGGGTGSKEEREEGELEVKKRERRGNWR